MKDSTKDRRWDEGELVGRRRQLIKPAAAEVPPEVESAITRWKETLRLLVERSSKEERIVGEVDMLLMMKLEQGIPRFKRSSVWAQTEERFKKFEVLLRGRIQRREIDPRLGHGFVFGLLFRLGEPWQAELVAGLAHPRFEKLGKLDDLTTTDACTSVNICHIVITGQPVQTFPNPVAKARDVLLVAYKQWCDRMGIKSKRWAALVKLLSDYGQWSPAQEEGKDLPGNLERMSRYAAKMDLVVKGAERYCTYFPDGQAPEDLLFKELKNR